MPSAPAGTPAQPGRSGRGPFGCCASRVAPVATRAARIVAAAIILILVRVIILSPPTVSATAAAEAGPTAARPAANRVAARIVESSRAGETGLAIARDAPDTS